jgi:hypothetical protein
MSTAFVPIKGDGAKLFYHPDQALAPAVNAVGWVQIVGTTQFNITAGTVSNTEIKTTDQPTFTIAGSKALPTIDGQVVVSPRNTSQSALRTIISAGGVRWFKIQYPSEAGQAEASRATKIFKGQFVEGSEDISVDAEVTLSFTINAQTEPAFTKEAD